MDLAHELRELGEQVDWPATPELSPALEPRRRSRRPLALGLAFAALVVAIAASLVVPSSRGAILRFFHLGAATIVRVETLPAAHERPLSVGIGPAVTLSTAKAAFQGVLLVPPREPLPAAHLSRGSVVSFVLSFHGKPVLLTEFPQGDVGFMKKFAGGGTQVYGTDVDGSPALFVSGQAHDFYFPGSSPRLAGNVLVWERDRATYRLESRSFTSVEAVSLARSLVRG